MQKVRLAVIGDWGHAGSVLEEVGDMPSLEVCGLAKVFPADTLAGLRRFPAAADAPLYDDHRRMLREAAPDVVVISTRLDRIAPLAAEAARAGCHVICEKPLALDEAGLSAVREALTGGGVHCALLLTFCVHPVLLAARQAVAAGLLGDVVLVNARKSYKWGSRPDWFADHALYGGTIPWVGIHAFDFIHSATGLAFDSVTAMQSNHAHPSHPGCEDNAVILARLSNGGHASISLDLCRPASAPTHGDDWLRIVGTRGVLEAHMAKGFCQLVTDDEPPHDLPLPPAPGLFRPLLEDLRPGAAAWAEQEAKAFLLTRAVLRARDAATEGRCLSLRD